MSTPIILPDGTKCYSGPTCKKHGTPAANITSPNDLNNKLDVIAPLPDADKFQPIHHRRIAVSFQEDRYKQHMEDAQAFSDLLTDEEREAVKKYTSFWYEDVVAYTYGLPRPHGYMMTYPGKEPQLMYGRGRTNDDNEWREQVSTIVKHMEAATKKWNKLSEPRVIYRGAVVHGEENNYQLRTSITEEQLDSFIEKNFAVDRTFYRKTMTSTTLDPVIAVHEFLPDGTSHNGSGIIMEYHTRKGIPVSKAAGTSAAMKEELEILLPPKTEYKVVAVHKNVPFTVNAENFRHVWGIHPDKYGRVMARKVTVVQVVEV